MRGLVNKYERAIKELEARIEFYKEEERKVKNNNKLKEENEIEYIALAGKYSDMVVFLTAKKQALEEVLEGRNINYYYSKF